MTGIPGSTLLNVARLLFNDRVLTTIVQPTIADLQREMEAAGSNRGKRLRARWRGYAAFWKIAIASPFAPWASADSAAGIIAFPNAMARLAVGSIVVMLIAVVGPVLGAWAAAVTALAAVFAIAIHVWYARHPSEVPVPDEPQRTAAPQINFSSTEVAGNIGGLIFVVGSVFIVAIGLPSVILFLFAATALGCFVAWALVAWHTKHPKRGLPENQIVLR